MIEKTGKGCGCGCGSTLLGLLLIALLASGFISSQAVALGDQPLTNPTEAQAYHLTWNQLIADREVAKNESDWNKNGCDFGANIGLLFGTPAYILYPLAGANPAGRNGSLGQMIDPNDWNRGFVPMNVPLPEGIFRTFQAYYWNTYVSGASHGLGSGCRLRLPKVPNKGIDG